MSKPTLKQLLELIPLSRLVPAERWEKLYSQWLETSTAEQREEVEMFLDFLVDHHAITSWHKENLLNGKYKGYFLGSYKLLKHLGSGGMSSVYLAEHTMMGRQVAIKILPRSRVNKETSYLERFFQEAQAAAALNHPHIVSAYDIDNENESIYYLVMEFVDGEDLNSLVKRGGVCDFSQAVDYICQAADGLQHAHEQGLVHRDMKPANLLVDHEGCVKILDMGLALFAESDRASLTVTYDENVLGTADYLAPEQAKNSHTVDCRADIYSLGCTLYFLIIGHPPFPEGTLPQRIAAHQKKLAPTLTELRPECPEDLSDICEKMMEKNPDNRQQTMTEVQENLLDWLLVHGYLPGQETMSSIMRSKARLQSIHQTLCRNRVLVGAGAGAGGGSSVNLDFFNLNSQQAPGEQANRQTAQIQTAPQRQVPQKQGATQRQGVVQRQGVAQRQGAVQKPGPAQRQGAVQRPGAAQKQAVVQTGDRSANASADMFNFLNQHHGGAPNGSTVISNPVQNGSGDSSNNSVLPQFLFNLERSAQNQNGELRSTDININDININESDTIGPQSGSNYQNQCQITIEPDSRPSLSDPMAETTTSAASSTNPSHAQVSNSDLIHEPDPTSSATPDSESVQSESVQSARVQSESESDVYELGPIPEKPAMKFPASYAPSGGRTAASNGVRTEGNKSGVVKTKSGIGHRNQAQSSEQLQTQKALTPKSGTDNRSTSQLERSVPNYKSGKKKIPDWVWMGVGLCAFILVFLIIACLL